LRAWHQARGRSLVPQRVTALPRPELFAKRSRFRQDFSCNDQSMSVLRTISVALAATLAAAPGSALPLSATERALAFAACAGRYSAEVEHRWLLRPAESPAVEARRDAFLALLDAISPDALDDGVPPHILMATRIEEKAAQAALLQRAAFHVDPLAAGAAQAAAERRIGSCGAWLLGA
jgi:hypothetical protein